MDAIRRHRAVLLVAIFLLGVSGLVLAQPYFLDQFKADPYRKPGEATCLTCHNDASGGAVIGFGEAFQKEGTNITPLLRAQFPTYFAYPVSKVGDSMVIHFSDPENRQIIIETGGKKIVVDVEKRRVDGQAATLPRDPVK